MLTVKTYLDRSDIHGIGCFAAEDIRRGVVVWAFQPDMDRRKRVEHVLSLPPLGKEHMLTHGYIDPENPDFVVLCGDNAGWINFADNPNLYPGIRWNGEQMLNAKRDIKKGEELTVSTATDADAARKLGL